MQRLNKPMSVTRKSTLSYPAAVCTGNLRKPMTNKMLFETHMRHNLTDANSAVVAVNPLENRNFGFTELWSSYKSYIMWVLRFGANVWVRHRKHALGSHWPASMENQTSWSEIGLCTNKGEPCGGRHRPSPRNPELRSNTAPLFQYLPTRTANAASMLQKSTTDANVGKQ